MTQKLSIRMDKKPERSSVDQKERKNSRRSMWLVLVLVLIAGQLPARSMYRGETVMQQTNVDQRLWAVWYLENVRVKTPTNAVRTYDLQTLLARPELQALNLASTLFVSLYFFENNVGVNVQNPPPDMSLKGTFSTAGNQLTVTMRDNRTQTFTYSFEGEKLVVSQTVLGMEISAIFYVGLNTKEL
jgi:hypothetical protein